MIVVAPLVLLWGEFFTRILLPQNVDSRMNIFRADPVIGYTYEPNAQTYEKGREYNVLYQINSLGLRDREYGPKDDGVLRILLIGDSMSASHGLPIEESLAPQLEKALQAEADAARMPLTFEVINTASGGYSPYNYWKAYRRWAPIFHPDVVVVGLSPDDYDCSNEGARYLIEDGATLAIYKDGQKPQSGGKVSIRTLRKWLSWNSEFYVLLRNFLYYNDFVGRLSGWMSAKVETELGPMEPYVVPQLENMQRAWKKTYSYLEELRRETAVDGVMLVVISIPIKMEIDSTDYRQSLAASGLTEDRLDLGQVLHGTSAFCKHQDIPLLDPRPALRERHAEVPCYFVYDGHWNAEGIRVAGNSLARQWRDLGLPPWGDSSVGKYKEKAPLPVQRSDLDKETSREHSAEGNPGG